MRGSIILYGSTITARQNHVLTILEKELDQKLNWDYISNFPDIKVIEPLEERRSIGIAQIKEGISFLQEKPLALKFKVLIIDKAQIMTDEAQNALLKILEEPPEYALIILLPKTESGLLPTLLSRCRKYKTAPSDNEQNTIKESWTLKYLFKLTTGQRLDWAEEFCKEEKDTIIDVLENWVEEGRVLMVSNAQKNKSYAVNIESILRTLTDLENTNVSIRFALEQLLLSFG